MATDAISAFGTAVQIDAGGSGYVTIAELRDITGPNLALGTEDVTPQEAAGGWREFIPTLLEGGEVTFDLNFVPTEDTHDYPAGLIKDMVDKTLRNFKVIFPDVGTTSWILPCYITRFTPGMPVEGELSAAVTLLVTGQPTLA